MSLSFRMRLVLGGFAISLIATLFTWLLSAKLTGASNLNALLYLKVLFFLTIGYAVNFFLSLKYTDSFKFTAVRLLVWGVVAYLCMSKGIDDIGNNSSELNKIFASNAGESILLLRIKLITWATGLFMSLVCIAVGFESPENKEKSKEKHK